jgi:hypothetical protein
MMIAREIRCVKKGIVWILAARRLMSVKRMKCVNTGNASQSLQNHVRITVSAKKGKGVLLVCVNRSRNAMTRLRVQKGKRAKTVYALGRLVMMRIRVRMRVTNARMEFA